MKTRILSGIVVAAIGLTCIVLGGYFLDALVLFVAAVGLYEFYRAFRHAGMRPIWLGYLWLGLLIWQMLGRAPGIGELYLPQTGTFNWFLPLQMLFLLLLLLFLVCTHPKYTAADVAVTFFGAWYVVCFCGYFLSVRRLEGGLYLFILALLGSVAADTFAFFIGSRFGRHKLIPRVSPNKSVEGSVAAFVGSALTLSLYGVAMRLSGLYTGLPFYHYPILGVLTGLVAQVGDLAASAVKRHTGVKDFGNLIPGHGGVLDRVDSYLPVFPVVYYYLLAFGAGA